MRTQWETGHLQPRRGSSLQPDQAGDLILDFQPPEQQPEPTETRNLARRVESQEPASWNRWVGGKVPWGENCKDTVSTEGAGDVCTMLPSPVWLHHWGLWWEPGKNPWQEHSWLPNLFIAFLSPSEAVVDWEADGLRFESLRAMTLDESLNLSRPQLLLWNMQKVTVTSPQKWR